MKQRDFKDSSANYNKYVMLWLWQTFIGCSNILCHEIIARPILNNR